MKDKLHVCCGEVYLEGYHNIDAPIKGYSFLASARPDLVKENLASKEKYYKYPFGERPVRLCVADELVDILKKDYPANYFKEILMVSAFEHFSMHEARALLKKFFSWLAGGGVLLLDVPEIEASFESMKGDRSEDNLAWNIRLIYGSQKNPYSFHKWGYTRETLEQEFKAAGFKKIEFMQVVPHSYPMIGARAEK